MSPASARDRGAEVMLALARELHLEIDEASLVERFLAAVETLVSTSGRTVVIRVDQERRRLVRASRGARLAPGAEDGPFELKRSALEKTRLSEAEAASSRIRVVDTPAPVVRGAMAGFSIPLVAGGDFYGTLDVAYVIPDAALVDADERLLIPIANQLSVALRNHRLHSESSFLRDYLGKLVDHAGALIMGIDPEWRITVYNRALSRLTGWESAEVVGTDLRFWVPEAERTPLLRLVVDVLAGRPVEPFHLNHTTKDGRPLHTVWNVTAVGRGAGTEAIVAVGQDVTQLESLQRQVIQAEKLATLGQLAAGVVHELNNPLTSVIVYAEYLLRKLERAGCPTPPFDAADADKLRRILEGAERIRNLSRDLVQYAKPPTEHLDVVSLNDTVRQALAFCSHELHARRARVSCRLTEDLPPLYAVRGQLEQVLINLVTNAAHALIGEGGLVSIHTFGARSKSGAPLVGFSVGDNGRGIPEADLPRIFEPFFTTKSDGKGSGLGLPIVQGIVERHHGHIDVTSRPGRGTLFTVQIPTAHIEP